jgi:ribosomal protein S17
MMRKRMTCKVERRRVHSLLLKIMKRITGIRSGLTDLL